ncbi:hypothetical protein FJTKL_02994 [Diaporthe vaccinii]|uniref:Uncharacterized protein n=1 Tax=Diaporthe vaccinii TaxID=105482 RepID=A0ABR4DX04_9PEZI
MDVHCKITVSYSTNASPDYLTICCNTRDGPKKSPMIWGIVMHLNARHNAQIKPTAPPCGTMRCHPRPRVLIQ